MLRGVLSAFVGISLLAGVANAQPPKQKDPPPPKKDAPKEKPPVKDKARPAAKEIVGMFKSKDLTKKTVTLMVDGKERVFKITDDTKIMGPLGGEAELKDDRLDTGYKITIIANSKNSDEAAEVKLPYRTDREGADKAKDKPKDKSKDKDDSKGKEKDKPKGG